MKPRKRKYANGGPVRDYADTSPAKNLPDALQKQENLRNARLAADILHKGADAGKVAVERKYRSQADALGSPNHRTRKPPSISEALEQRTKEREAKK